MSDETVIWTVGLRCRAEDEEKFNTWYDDVHVPMLPKGGGVRHVARFRLADEAYHVGATTQTSPKYLTIYEFESRQVFESWMNGPARIEAGRDKEVPLRNGAFVYADIFRADRPGTFPVIMNCGPYGRAFNHHTVCDEADFEAHETMEERYFLGNADGQVFFGLLCAARPTPRSTPAFVAVASM